MFVFLVLVVWLIHHRTGHLPRKNDVSWEAPNQLKKYGSDDDMEFETHTALRDRAATLSQDILGDLPPRAKSSVSSGQYAAGVVPDGKGPVLDASPRSSVDVVAFPALAGTDDADHGTPGDNYIKMSAQERSARSASLYTVPVRGSNVTAPEPTYASNATALVGIGDFLQPEMGLDVPGAYGVGSVVPQRSSVGSVSTRSNSDMGMDMAGSESLMHHMIQRMSTLERENEKLRRSVKASMKLSMAAARTSSGAIRTSVAARESMKRKPLPPAGTVVFDARPSEPLLDEDVNLEDSTYSVIQKTQAPALKAKAVPTPPVADPTPARSISSDATEAATPEPSRTSPGSADRIPNTQSGDTTVSSGDTTAASNDGKETAKSPVNPQPKRREPQTHSIRSSVKAVFKEGAFADTQNDTVADAIVLPGTMNSHDAVRGRGSAESIISVERLNPRLSVSGTTDVLNPTRGSVSSQRGVSRSQSIKVGTRRQSSVKSMRSSNGGSTVMPSRSSLSTGSDGSARAARPSLKQAWSSDANETAIVEKTAL